VLDTPCPVRFCVVNFAILPSHPKVSAHAYEKIWMPKGSQFVITSRRVRAKLQERVTVLVELAMCYQNPSIESALKKLKKKSRICSSSCCSHITQCRATNRQSSA
jgi:ferrochelatase